MAEEKDILTLDAYYIPQKVEAFVKSYIPCSSEQDCEEVFTDQKLRVYFQAYPIPSLGDLLIPYMDALEERGYTFQTSVTGEPAIFVCTRVSSNRLLQGLTEEEEAL